MSIPTTTPPIGFSLQQESVESGQGDEEVEFEFQSLVLALSVHVEFLQELLLLLLSMLLLLLLVTLPSAENLRVGGVLSKTEFEFC